MYTNLVCTKIKNDVVRFSGNPGENGKPRKFGLLDTTDSAYPTIVAMDKMMEQQLQACGVSYVYHSFPYTGAPDTYGQQPPTYATTNMQDFKTQGVTTILDIGGLEAGDAKAGQQLGYFPEWIAASDGAIEGNVSASSYPSQEWSHAWVVTPNTLQNADGQPAEPPCVQALLEVDPNMDRQSFDIGVACGDWWDDIRELFIGIQIAGPHLTPPNMDKGFHSIPPKPSTDPTQPSCFYNPGDFTCVKDAVLEWWDPNAHPTGPGGSTATAGCWRMWRNGQRYLGGQWPPGIIDYEDRNVICNLLLGRVGASIRTTS
jgi:hypothetical protein